MPPLEQRRPVLPHVSQAYQPPSVGLQHCQGIEYVAPQGLISITAPSGGIVKVRFTRNPRFGADDSWAVLPSVLASATGAPFAFTPGADEDRLTTPGLAVSIQRSPFRVTFIVVAS